MLREWCGMKKALAFVLAVVLLLPMLSAGASAIESYTLEVGDTKLLKIDSSGKALENSVWESNSPDVIVTESNLTYCTVQAVAPTEGMTAIVSCTYRYWIYSGSFSYLATGRESFYITVEAADPTAISLPAGRTVGLGGRITLTPTLTPAGSVAELTWSTGNSAVATVDQSGSVCGVSGGSTRITVRTHNGLSASCTVTVAEPALTLTDAAPAYGAVDWDPAKPIILTYSARLAAGTAWDRIALADLTTGAEVSVEKAINGRTLTLTPQVLLPGHSYMVTVPAGALKNLTGAPLSDSNTLPFTVRAMALLATQPERGEESAPTDETITMTFDTPLSPGTRWGEIVLTGPAGPVPAQVRLQGEILTITPSQALEYHGDYTLTVPAGALAEPGGMENTAAYTLSFTTWSGLPQLTSASPADGDTQADPGGKIILTFRWPVQAGPEAEKIILVRKDTGETVGGKLAWLGEQLTFTPSQPLSRSVAYRFTVPAGGVENDQGQINESLITLSFTTWDERQSTVAPPVFSSNSTGFTSGYWIVFDPVPEGVEIYYTVDGSDPLRNGRLYDPEHTDWHTESAYVRAVAVSDGAVSEEIWKYYAPSHSIDNGRLDSLGSGGDDAYNAAAAGDGVWAAAGYVTLDKESAGDWEGVSGRGGRDAAVVQYTPDGSVQWKAAFGGVGEDCFYGLAALPQGDWIAAGSSRLDGAPGGDWGERTGEGGLDGALARFDKNGSLTWCASVGGAGADQFQAVAANDNGFAAAGYAARESAGTGGLAGLDYRGGDRDGLIAAYGLGNQPLWSRLYGGAGDDCLYGLAAVPDGYVAVGYVSADSFGTGDLTGISGWGGRDAILVKFDLQGRVMWQTRFGGRGNDVFYAVTPVSDGYAAVGQISTESCGNGDLPDYGSLSSNSYDNIIAKFDQNGKLVWKNRVSGLGTDVFYAVADTGYGLVAAGESSEASMGTGLLATLSRRGGSDAVAAIFSYGGAFCRVTATGGISSDVFRGLAVLPQGVAAVGGSAVGSFNGKDWSGIQGQGGWDATYRLHTSRLNIYYDAAGGEGAPGYHYGKHGELVTLSAQIPTKEGAAFLGWSPWPEVPAAVYQPGETLVLDRDLHLYAVWDQPCPAGTLGLAGQTPVRAGEEFARTLYFTAQEPVTGGRVSLRLPQGISCLSLESLDADTALLREDGQGQTIAVEFLLARPLQAGETAAVGTLRLLADGQMEPGDYDIQADLENSFLTGSDGGRMSFADVLLPPVTVGPAQAEGLFLLGPSLIAGPTRFELAGFPTLPADAEPVWQVTEGEAVVDRNGLVTPLADGTVTLTATVGGLTAAATVTARLPDHTLSGTAAWADGAWTVEAAFSPAADKLLVAAWRSPDGLPGPVLLREALAGQTAAVLTLEAPAEGTVTLYLLGKDSYAPLAPACPVPAPEEA